MNNYEAVVIFSIAGGDEAVEALRKKFEDLVSANATLESVDDWNVRDLAYEINFETKGHYFIYNFSSSPEFPAELDRVLKITDGVLRSLIVRK